MRRWVLLAAVLCLAVGGGATLAWRRLEAPGPMPADRSIVVPAGTTAQLATALTDAELIAYPFEFR
ncbi:MAG: hypothetical protein H7251_13660, partial [Acetobacteraceae bacterium]|nr:hypothetical protein [Acetobacteraceae bacterium]